MGFTEQDKLKALAILHIFETSRPFGDYAAVAVLNDGAGVSYGINQFTHRSGSLAAVVAAYLNGGGQVGRETLGADLPTLRRTTVLAVNKLAADEQFKKALRASAITSEMKAAQNEIAFERYLQPAIAICAERGFVLPLSLAVVYDSITQGSWERIAERVGAAAEEKAWITEYVRKRHFWLTNIPRLKPTNYRTKFFLDQIAIGNWELKQPMVVHGTRLTAEEEGEKGSGGEEEKKKPDPARNSAPAETENIVSSAADKFDSVENAVTAVTSRADAAKSLWTTIIGTLWQAVWAIFGFFAGLPREVWIVVAIIAAVLMLVYLYRQIEMGKLRER